MKPEGQWFESTRDGMGQHVSERTGKAKKAYETQAEANAQCGWSMNSYACAVCDKYHVGRELKFRGSMRAQLNAALARRGSKRGRR